MNDSSYWDGGGRPGRSAGRSPGGPPPWLAGLFGLVPQESPRSQRVRRGDVRAAILDVLAAEPMNGYQVIQQIGEKSHGAWRPSPGSVYPTIAQLEDEGLVTSAAASGPRVLELTEAGKAYCADHLEELAAVWSAFGRPSEDAPDYAALKPELGQVMSAVWQIITQGSDKQRRDAIGVLTETRRKLYRLLAEEDQRPADNH
jgi:DNA-binding PadR family transcriptional regulator